VSHKFCKVPVESRFRIHFSSSPWVTKGTLHGFLHHCPFIIMVLSNGFSTQSSPMDVAMQHGSTATIAEDVLSPSALATERGSGAPIVEDVSYPPTVATEDGSSAMLAEDVLEVVIPFLTMEPPAHTMRGPKEGRTSNFTTGEHVHVWCDRCANFESPCAATHNACPDCRILRTIMQLSRRWFEFMWDYRMDMETAES
jgi:hypothetical protein